MLSSRSKKIPGFGTTIDVILANGTLKVGDEFVIAGLHGEAIISRVKNLLTPPIMKELRVKSMYEKHSEVSASMGIKIVAPGLDEAVAGSQLFVIMPGDDIEDLKERAQEAVKALSKKLHRSGVGVYVQASTLGSMEALLDFLNDSCKIPVANIRIGPVHKKDVLTASIMHDKGKPEYSCILAFDVQVTVEAEAYAQQLGVRIFREDIIYRLEQDFQEYLDEINNRKKEEARKNTIFPCVIRFLPDHMYRDRDPIIMGVLVQAGVVRMNTPICVIKDGEILDLGKITSIQKDKKNIEEGNTGDEVAVQISPDKRKFMFGRQFDEKDLGYSKITRQSLDAIKEGYPEFCENETNFDLLKNLKNLFNII